MGAVAVDYSGTAKLPPHLFPFDLLPYLFSYFFCGGSSYPLVIAILRAQLLYLLNTGNINFQMMDGQEKFSGMSIKIREKDME